MKYIWYYYYFSIKLVESFSTRSALEQTNKFYDYFSTPYINYYMFLSTAYLVFRNVQKSVFPKISIQYLETYRDYEVRSFGNANKAVPAAPDPKLLP